MRRGIVRILCAVLCVLFVFLSFAACGKKQTEASFLKNDTVLAGADGSGGAYRMSADGLTAAAATDGLTLLYDEAAAAVAVRDAETGLVWTALPTQGQTPAYSLIATVAGEAGRYYLNSQDHAVAFGGVSAEKTDAGIAVTYVFSDRAETAQKSEDALLPGELQVRVPAVYSLEDGGLTVKIDAASVFVSDGFVLEKLSVLPFFGAIRYDTAAVVQNEAQTAKADGDETPASQEADSAAAAFSDFILMPDGCGAAVYTKFTDPANADLTFRVSPQAGDGVHTASLGVFGVKTGAQAFACTVTGGLPAADIRSVQLVSGAERVCAAWAEFRLAETQIYGDRYYYGLPYRGELRLVYQFLTGRRATYIAMADVARETMIRAGLLRETRLSAGTVPLALSVLCSVTGARETAASDFRQAEDLLNQLKAKGVDAAEVVMQGAFQDGLLQNASSRLRADAALGGEAAFTSLCDYARRQNYRIYAGVNLLYAKDAEAAKKLNGDQARIFAPLGGFASEWQENAPVTALLGAAGIEKQAVKILRRLRDGAPDGVCLNDVAATHYYDAFAKENAAAVSGRVSAQLDAFGGAGRLALSGANGAMLREPDLFLDIPFATAGAASDSYVPVPLLPAVLHGSALYTGAAFNGSGSPRLAFLKCAEYGGIPYYAWSCSAASALYYANSLAQAAEDAAQLNALLGDLSDVRISDHRKLANGLFRTDYENGATVFVNYNHYSVTVSGFTIPPYDYLRMN